MGFVKGTDGIARTVRNPLEGSIGDVALSNVAVSTISASGNISGDVLFSPSTPADWANASAIYNVSLALNALANATANFESGTGFSFLGPFSNDAAANLGGVAIGQVYYNNSGGLVVRQT